MAVTKPKPIRKPRGSAMIPDKDNPYHGCGPGKIRDPGTGECISHTAYNKKHGAKKKPSKSGMGKGGFKYG